MECGVGHRNRGIVIVVVAFLLFLCVSVLGDDTPKTEPTTQPITRAMLTQRLVELEQGLEQAKANLHAYEGAIADCKYWLDKLNKPELAPSAIVPVPEPKK